jgi:hypothetical protein
MFYTLTVILFEEYAGDYRSQDFRLAFLANIYYWFYPLLLMIRLRSKHVFTRRIEPKPEAKTH